MNSDMISVILITYNNFKYINDTLDSIFIQDYPSIEIIIADDGSKDFPENDILNYINANKGYNIKNYKIIHSDKNVGTVKNINKGIKNATGDYIKIIAGDDVFYDENVFKNQVECIKKNNEALIVTGKICECDDNLNIIKKSQVENTNNVLNTLFDLEPKAFFNICYKQSLFPLATQTLLFDKTYFNKYGLYDEKYVLLEDSPMQVRIIINRVPIVFVNSFVVKHRANVGISSNESFFSNKKSQYYLDLANFIKYEKITRPEIFPKFTSAMQYKKEMYRYRMSITNNKIYRVLLTVINIDSLLWYIFSFPDRIIDSVLKLLNNFRRLKK